MSNIQKHNNTVFVCYKVTPTYTFIAGVFTDVQTAIAWEAQPVGEDEEVLYSFHTFELNEVRHESNSETKP